jgi:hypothetical protein
VKEPHGEAPDLQAFATARIHADVAGRCNRLDRTINGTLIDLVENGAEFLKGSSIQAGQDVFLRMQLARSHRAGSWLRLAADEFTTAPLSRRMFR